MSHATTFGIIGGYGATGRSVAFELWKSTGADILIGGRDASKASALADEFDGRVSAVHVDALDPRSADTFCRQCSIVVNCAAPLMVVQDRVAQAAFRARCHYIDTAGTRVVKERMLPRAEEIADSGLSFVISAGWIPGLSEVLPTYAETRARETFDTIESLTVYFGDTGEWSPNALREMAWLVRQLGSRTRGYFRRGEWVGVSLLRASRVISVGEQLAVRRFTMLASPELQELGARLTHCTVQGFTCVPGIRTALAAILVQLLPLPSLWHARLLGDALRRDRLPGGFLVAEVVGRSGAAPRTFTAQTGYEAGREYWINGLVPAAVARMLVEGAKVMSGVHFLADAVDPTGFMAALRKSGLQLTEHLEPND